MPRASKATQATKAAAATNGAPAPTPMPPTPAGSLPGGPPQFAGAPPTNFGPPPGFGQPIAPPQAAPAPNFGAPQTIDTSAVMAAAQQATQAPPFQFPQQAQAPQAPMPATAPPAGEIGAHAQVLPQILVKIDQLMSGIAHTSGQVLEAVGKSSQARTAEYSELKQQLAIVLDHLGGIGEIVTKMAQTLQIVPAQQPQQSTPAPASPIAAPVQYQQATTQAQLSPQQQPQQQFQAVPAPQPTGDPVLTNPNWNQEGIRDYTVRTARLSQGRNWGEFAAAMQSVIPPTSLNQNDFWEFLCKYQLVNTQTGVILG